jgi:hypothetical protein
LSDELFAIRRQYLTTLTMKTLGLLRIVSASVIIALFSGCCLPHTGPKALVGSWTNFYETVWTFRADGTYDVDYDHYGGPDAWGRYRIEGNTVTLVSAGGFTPEGCRSPGVYRLRKTGCTLRFTLIKDGCKLRRDNTLLDWRPYCARDEW